MLFQKRLKRASDFQKQQNAAQDDDLQEKDEELKLQKGEFASMVFSALITILPACIAALSLLLLLCWLFLKVFS